MKVLLSNGKYGIINTVEVEELEIPETTYNFEVEDYHTYYVSESGILVHNVRGEDLADDMVKFKSQSELELHFGKHGKEFGGLYQTADDYLAGADYVIKNGTYIPEMNGYIKFFGAGGKANYAFVGMTQGGGNIRTFGLRSVSQLTKIPWIIP